ncbi:DUF4132 domain-containing protein [Streptosporangium sp. 'caverna']|uniref:DUF4132 domain-containing protein n=1 Tax=Streptosporangium sp. 'caverna' TaxID=2202249 RepID=UPI000D7D3F2C|nr:DUF4132 domain-containing protein [Streptosporangium sp. 'caverna']AWS42771.1 hypothetical protein DKM19_16770 [Streptosporangium sp. 'caverna']
MTQDTFRDETAGVRPLEGSTPPEPSERIDPAADPVPPLAPAAKTGLGLLDELSPEQLGRLGDEIDQTRVDVFARLDELYVPERQWYVQPFAEKVISVLGPDIGDAQWRAMGVWAQLRTNLSHTREHDHLRDPVSLALCVAERKLAWTGDEIELLWQASVEPILFDRDPASPLILPLAVTRKLSHEAQRRHLPLMRQVQELLNRSRGWFSPQDKLDLDILIAEHAEDDPVEATTCLVGKGDGFAAMMASEYGVSLGSRQTFPLLRHWITATSARPSVAWLRRAAALLTPDTAALIQEVLSRLPAYRETAIYLHARTATPLRGMVWTCELIDEPWVVPLLGEVALAAGTGIGGSGPNSRSEMLANAALGVLAKHGGLEVVAPLARLQTKIRRRSILAKVAQVLDAVAAQAGLSREQLLDRTVPTFGLGPDGVLEEKAGEHVLRLALNETGTPLLTFLNPAGKPVKSAPKAVRESHGGLLSEFRKLLAEVRKTLPSERLRIERALAEDRLWRWNQVEEFFLDHPVTGVHGRRLIWQILQGPAGIPVKTADGWELTDPLGRRIQPRADTPVQLWHPIGAAVEEVRSRRDHLLEIGLRQPFKQAFREVYLLTPAEEQTGTFSNRFAGHVLRYGQAKALLSERGWTGLSLGHWDAAGGSGQGEAVKEVPGWRARWDMELPWGSWEHDEYGAPASSCISGPIRFDRTDVESREAVPLTEVPPLVLSEIMRDADLAVGVSSVGLDPQGQGDYWQSYNFGDLTESAEVRRDALTRLLPRLRIADRVELAERFLRVRGDLRTYKIHLGSGNILMEPNDAYLCIVPQGAFDQVFLPFEEDGGMLAVIMSKAFLLADDTAITDPSITHQIRS